MSEYLNLQWSLTWIKTARCGFSYPKAIATSLPLNYISPSLPTTDVRFTFKISLSNNWIDIFSILFSIWKKKKFNYFVRSPEPLYCVVLSRVSCSSSFIIPTTFCSFSVSQTGGSLGMRWCRISLERHRECHRTSHPSRRYNRDCPCP